MVQTWNQCEQMLLTANDKSESVLFCQLTDAQKDAYESYLRTDVVARVLAGRCNAFPALTSLLKVCNHPHLLNWDEETEARGGRGESCPRQR